MWKLWICIKHLHGPRTLFGQFLFVILSRVLTEGADIFPTWGQVVTKDVNWVQLVQVLDDFRIDFRLRYVHHGSVDLTNHGPLHMHGQQEKEVYLPPHFNDN